MKKTIRLTENELKSFIKESVDRVINEIKKDRNKFNIDGAEYESTSVKRGGAKHPGYRWKDHESHDPEISKNYRRRKDGYRYAADYEEKPNTLHKNLTNKLKEDFDPYGIVEWNHFDNDNFDTDYYNGFVVVDSTRAVLGNFDNYNEAVEYARELATKNKYGTYEVYGCDENGYALEEDYPEDNTLVYSTDEDFK